MSKQTDKELGAVQVIETVDNTALTAYANRDVVKELAFRLLAFHPQAAEVGQAGMYAAAQLAIVMGASPLPGTNEIHIYKDNHGGVTVQPGINYWRRRAVQYGGVHWITRPRPMTDTESELYGVGNDEIGAICRGARQFDIESLRNAGLTIADARESSGVFGLGTVSRRTAKSGRYAEQKNGRPLVWTAIKRCETDVLKQLFPFVPGEQITPGLGLQRDPQTGKVTIGDSRQWEHAGDPVAIAANVERRAIRDGAGGESLSDLNARIFGTNRGAVVADVADGDNATPDVADNMPPDAFGDDWAIRVEPGDGFDEEE